ncbi:MAG: hypothetical protein HFJ38_05845 [Bacilli bacterium]|nr:hypothetical protein [Bacilli bacterium]
MDLSNRAEEIVKGLVNKAESVRGHEIDYGERNTWKNGDEKRAIAKELNDKGYIKYMGGSGLYKIHCIVTEKAFKKYGIDI